MQVAMTGKRDSCCSVSMYFLTTLRRYSPSASRADALARSPSASARRASSSAARLAARALASPCSSWAPRSSTASAAASAWPAAATALRLYFWFSHSTN